MRNLLSQIARVPKKWLAVATIGALVAILPVSNLLAANVTIEGSIGVANVTRGDTTYQPSVNASYDQVVKFQVYYHNRELAGSGLNANNLRVKINIPQTAGSSQTVNATISSDNSNTVNDSATVNLDHTDAYLQYVPGSAVWRHDVGTDASPSYVDTKISDAVVTSGQGLVLEDEKPCYNFAATVTVLARVMVPGVTITKQVRGIDVHSWSTSNTANPGDTLQYLISYKNSGNTTEHNVVIRDSLPPNFQIVPNTTYLKNSNNANGVLFNSATGVAGSGIVIGDYAPGAAGYVWFNVKVPTADQLSCDATTFTNIGVAHPEGMSEYYNSATTVVNKVCNQPNAAYQCNELNLVNEGGRKVKATVDYSATNGASLSTVRYDWGDSSTPLLTDKTSAEHTYAKDGTYTVAATLTFNLPNSTTATSECSKAISFKTPNVTTTTKVLPNTGAGDVAELFAGTSVLGSVGHFFVSRRRK